MGLRVCKEIQDTSTTFELRFDYLIQDFIWLGLVNQRIYKRFGLCFRTDGVVKGGRHRERSRLITV